MLGHDNAPWNRLPVAQQPEWPDHAAVGRAEEALSAAPALVPFDECQALREALAPAVVGDAFLLTGGDCAETFDSVDPAHTRSMLTTLLDMGECLSGDDALDIVYVGRMAGQYTKPRSSPHETQGPGKNAV